MGNKKKKRKASLGSNPLASRSTDDPLREVLSSRPEAPRKAAARRRAPGPPASRKKEPAAAPTDAPPAPAPATEVATPAPKPSPPVSAGRSAVILCGPGAYAAFEVGVLKALAGGASPALGQRPLEPRVLTGTSIGSFNAAVLAAHSSDGTRAAVARLEQLWLERIAERGDRANAVYRLRGNPAEFLSPGRLVRRPLQPWQNMLGDGAFFARDIVERGVSFLRSSGSVAHRTLEQADLGAMVDTGPFRELVGDVVDLARVRSSRVALRVCATNWESGELRVFSNGDLDGSRGHDVILAASSRPGFFPPVTVDGKPHVGDGVVASALLDPAIDAGADTLHVIYLDPDVKRIPFHQLRNTFDTFDRMLALRAAGEMNAAIDNARWINRSLGLLEGAGRNGDARPEELRDFVKVAARIEERLRARRPYRKLTIHRYHPADDLGGALGFLNFRREHLAELIGRGQSEAARHDCEAAGCVLPD